MWGWCWLLKLESSMVLAVAGLGVPAQVNYTHPPRSAKAEPKLMDSLGVVGGPSPRVC